MVGAPKPKSPPNAVVTAGAGAGVVDLVADARGGDVTDGAGAGVASNPPNVTVGASNEPKLGTAGPPGAGARAGVASPFFLSPPAFGAGGASNEVNLHMN